MNHKQYNEEFLEELEEANKRMNPPDYSTPDYSTYAQEGDVVQINERYEQTGWIGAFVLVEKVKSFGVQGFMHVIQTDDESASTYIRLSWSDIDFIGRAKLTHLHD